MQIFQSLHGGFQPKRYRPGNVGNWSGHLPFAHDLIAATKPNLIVELGTHYGESYFGFCQAVRENDIACSCYAIDTWIGEAQAGFYGDDVYADVTAYNAANYSDFSYLLQATFDASLSKFTDSSIDILHIDGLHTYQAVAHDLHNWIGKVRPGGIILLHDVMVRHADFGAWKVWEELASIGQHFTFKHSWGLGVFQKPGSDGANPFLTLLFESGLEAKEHVRKFYSLCATKLDFEYANGRRANPAKNRLVISTHPFGPDGYTQDLSFSIDFQPGRWQHLSIPISHGIARGPLRIDPSSQPGILDVSGIRLRQSSNDQVLWSAEQTAELASLRAGGTLAAIPVADSTPFCRFFSYGSDPQFFLPVLDSTVFDQPLTLEIWLRFDQDTASLLPIFEEQATALETTRNLREELAKLRRQTEDRQLDSSNERELLVAERHAIAQDRDTIAQEKAALAKQAESLAADLRRLQSELYVTRTDFKRKSTEEAQLRADYGHIHNLLNQAMASRSWRITKPIRTLAEKLRGQR